MLRVLHTSDWHLGHTLHDLDRQHEHDRFLAWLLEVLAEERIDALLITGDLFDSANPSAASQGRWFSFLAQLRARFPDLDIVVIGGNHDSASRLDAPRPILESMNIHILGGLPREEGGALDLGRLLVPLRGADGAVAAWVGAVPFLRPGDLPRAPDPDATSGESRLIAGIRAVYGEVLAALRARRAPGQALLVTGHCYLDGALLSEHSERKIQGGNHDALPGDVFPDDLAYVALGHLHLPQAVGGREHVRYAGAPLALSMAEAGYAHQVRVLEIEGGALAQQRERLVPQRVGMLRLPADGPRPVEEVLPLLQALPPQGDLPEVELPFLEVCVALELPAPGLRRQVQEALEGRAARLVKLTAVFAGTGEALADALPLEQLQDIQPEEVFRRRYKRVHDGDPPPELLASFHELLEEVLRDDAPEGPAAAAAAAEASP